MDVIGSSNAVQETRIEGMLFHLTTEDHIRTSNEPAPADGDAGGGSFASEQELASERPTKRLVEIWSRLPGISPLRSLQFQGSAESPRVLGAE
jgi:hypothetical protein